MGLGAQRSLQIRLIIFLDKLIDLLGHLGIAAHFAGQDFAKRDLFLFWPGVGLPQLSAQKRLGAVVKDFLDADADGDSGGFASG